MAATKKDKKTPAIGIDLSFLLKGLTKDKAATVLAAFRVKRPDISDEDNMQNALDESIAKWARNYSQTTRDALKKAIGEGIQNGQTYGQIAKTLNEISEIHANDSAKTMAKTVRDAAGNMANKAVWQQNGVKTLEWYCGPTPCPECATLEGKVVNIGDSFFEDEHGQGNTPPLHENCDCYLRPGPIDATLQ
jgi:SPP1 gp7 family putative phage head morphogenesis protein